MTKLTRLMAASVVACLTTAAEPCAAQQAETLKVPTFGTITIYRTSAMPQQVVLFLQSASRCARCEG